MKLCPFYQLDREILAFGRYDADLHAFYDRFIHPGMTCLDVGANIGDSTLHMAQKVGSNGYVHAFEPAPLPLSRLREHVTTNGFDDWVSVHQLALSNQTGTAQLAVAELAVENQGMGSLVNQDNAVVSQVVMVDVQPLDAFIADHPVKRLDLIKIDIQGAELMFLDGGRGTLEKWRPTLLMEISLSDLSCVGQTPAGLVSAVESFGYSVHSLGRHGAISERVSGPAVPLDFSVSNVVCLPL